MRLDRKDVLSNIKAKSVLERSRCLLEERLSFLTLSYAVYAVPCDSLCPAESSPSSTHSRKAAKGKRKVTTIAASPGKNNRWLYQHENAKFSYHLLLREHSLNFVQYIPPRHSCFLPILFQEKETQHPLPCMHFIPQNQRMPNTPL